MSLLKEISSGFILRMREEMNALTEEESNAVNVRLSECEKCEIRDGSWCSKEKYGRAVKDLEYKKEKRQKGMMYSGCGCYLPIKTRSLLSKCPLGKWEAWENQ